MNHNCLWDNFVTDLKDNLSKITSVNEISDTLTIHNSGQYL
ncbi:MAG: hypothetical protein WA816_00845 [Bacteroidales bacterium]